MELQTEFQSLSNIPDRILTFFRLAQQQLQTNRSYFSQLLTNRCSKLDKIRAQRQDLTKRLASCHLTKLEISALNRLLQDVGNIKSDIRAKQRNTKMLKERMAEVLAKRHELVSRRGEIEKEGVRGRARANSADRLMRRVGDVRQVSGGRVLVREGSTARFALKQM